MSLDKRRQVAERIIALLREEGYIRTGGEINRETGECRINLVSEDDSMWINIRDAPPSLLAEFCNVYEEIHALGFGLIHSCTRLRPLGYSEIAKEDLSPELSGTWEPNIITTRRRSGCLELSSPWRSRGHRQPGDGWASARVVIVGGSDERRCGREELCPPHPLHRKDTQGA